MIGRSHMYHGSCLNNTVKCCSRLTSSVVSTVDLRIIVLARHSKEKKSQCE